MKRLLATSLALCLATTVGATHAQTYNGPGPQYGQDSGTRYDYARVIRVDPVIGSGNGSSYQTSGQRCYERQQQVAGGYDDRYGNGGYNNGGYNNGGYSNGGYNNGGYQDTYGRNDGYYDQYGNYRRNGTQVGATMATVIGGIVGAAIGSQVGGGSARYATSAIGSMVGGMAGRSIYDQRQRQQQLPRTATVTVCDPVPADRPYDSYRTGDGSVNAYDVTYEYAGQQYTARTAYHPGDRIRVRVDVRAE